MKTFHQYIQLNEVYGQESMSKELFNLPVAGKDGDIMSFKIPMGDANIKRVMPKEIRGPVFHVTSESNHDKLVKGQNKKSGLSGFRNMKPRSMEMGIASGGGFIYELDANLLGSFEKDVRSGVDKTGRRWVTLQSLLDTGFHNTSPYPHINDLHRPLEKNDLGSLPKDIETYVSKVIKEYGSKSSKNLITSWKELPEFIETAAYGSPNPSVWTKKTGDKEYGKIMSSIIKGYIDTVNKSYSKNAKKLAEALKKQYNDQLNKAHWDEMIVNQYKIKRLHVLLSAPQFTNGLWSDVTKAIEDAESRGIEVVEWTEPMGLQKHISSTTTTPVKKIMKTVSNFLSVKDYPDEMWNMNEAFDTKIKWTKTDDRPASTGGHIKKYRGKVETRKPEWKRYDIEMIYNIAPKAPEVNIVFTVDGTMKVTAKGSQMKIFGAVINHITSWIKEHPRINLVNFSAHKEDPDDPDENSRSKLYSRLVKRYASKMGFKVEEIDIDVMVLYVLKRK
jgi:hypothetical protein